MGFKPYHFIKHKTKDSLSNLGFHAKNLINSKRKGTNSGILPPAGYEVDFEDNFESPLNLENWRYGMPWGTVHPSNLNQYYDSDGSLSYVGEGGLNLAIKNSPKTFRKEDLARWQQTPDLPEEFTVPVGVGYVSTKKSWQYGWFEAWIKLPKGQSYWPAFWTCGSKTWPPEIDIFEAYSHNSPEYDVSKGIKSSLKSISPNLHYGFTANGTKQQYGASNNFVADITERFVQFVCHWEEDFIKIYYDGNPVFVCTDPEILDWFSFENAEQFVILNHGLHPDRPQAPDEVPVVVRSFRVLQKRDNKP